MLTPAPQAFYTINRSPANRTNLLYFASQSRDEKKKNSNYIPVASLQPVVDYMREQIVDMGKEVPEVDEQDFPTKIGAYFEVFNKLAKTNQLTGLQNRRMFDLHYERAFNESKETGKSMSLAIIDLDYFKSQVDMFGHAYASGLVKRVGEILREELDPVPHVTPYLYGGEEFCVILKNHKSQEAAKVINGVLQKIKKDKVFQSKNAEYKEKLTEEVKKLKDKPDKTDDENFQYSKCRAWLTHYKKHKEFTATAAVADRTLFPEKEAAEDFFIFVDSVLDRAKKGNKNGSGRNCCKVAKLPKDHKMTNDNS